MGISFIKHSLIIPVYKNEANLPDLLVAIDEFGRYYGSSFEAVLVVDGSPDHSYQVLQTLLPQQVYAAQLICLSRNFGAFSAIRCGLQYARGEFFAVMAADLQEPPHLIYDFFKCLEQDTADVVFGKRTGRSDGLSGIFSRIYWGFYRRFVISGIPSGGVDIFGCNNLVRESILDLKELNTSLVGQLFWVGYRRYFVPYERQVRKHGKSAWKVRTKLRYLFDSLYSFSDLPIIVLLFLGTTGLAISFLLGVSVLILRLLDKIVVPGYTPIVLIVLGLGSIGIIGQGILGGYLWRTLQNTTNRPTALVAKRTLYKTKDESAK